MSNESTMETWKDWVQSPARQKAMTVREVLTREIREYFFETGFRETLTPTLVRSPGMETHIRPIATACGGAYLHTSPEFAMKKLLCGGLKKIYQMAPAYRDEPFSKTHRPEFTLLEWYRADAEIDQIMNDAEVIFERIGKKLGISHLNLSRPWQRFTIAQLFEEHCQIDLRDPQSHRLLARQCEQLGFRDSKKQGWDDLFFKVWLNCIEPELPRTAPVFVTHYPPSQAALAEKVRDSQGHLWANRFEVFSGGLEIANAFQELTDPQEQRERFEKDMLERERIYGAGFPANPIDETFLKALEEGLPRSAGIALGVDRLVMLFAQESDIGNVQWLSPEFNKI